METEEKITDEVVAYRLTRFVELGFDMEQAELLAQLKVDWHDAERLVADGCDQNLAFAILA